VSFYLINFNIIKKNIFNILIILYLVFYIIGPALINIFVTLLSFFSLYYLFHKKSVLYLLLKDKVSLLLLLFFLYIFLKDILFYQINAEILSFIRLIIIFFSITIFKSLKNNDLNINIHIFSTLLLILCLDSIIQYIFGYNILGFSKFDGYRLTSFFKDEPIIGSFILKLFFPFLIYFFFEKKNNFIFYLIIILSFISILLSGERMPFLQLIFGMFIILFFLKNKLRAIFMILSIFFIIFVLLFKYSNIEKRYSSTIQGLINLDNNLRNVTLSQSLNNSSLGSVNQYYLNFSSGIELWKQNKLFGNGYRFYKSNCSTTLTEPLSKGCSTHPHNIYIEILSDYGIFGILLFSFFLFFLIFDFIKNHNNKKYFGFLIVILIISFPLVTSQSIFSSYYGSIFFFYLFILKILNNKTN